MMPPASPASQPFPQQLPPNLYVDLPEEEENDVLLELAEEMGKEFIESLEEAFPDYIISPAFWPKREKRLQNYLTLIAQAYPTDEAARLQELYVILDTKTPDAVRMGLIPPPISQPWDFLILVPPIFKHFQRDLRDLYLHYARKLDEDYALDAWSTLPGVTAALPGNVTSNVTPSGLQY
ncbi:MAG: hypothetical protein AB7E70_20200 [Hyphomicrobiaceae bacterium]